MLPGALVLSITKNTNNEQYFYPLRYLINTKVLTKVHVLLEQSGPDTAKLPFIGVYALKQPSVDKPTKRVFVLTPKDVIGNTEFMNDLQAS